MKEVKFIRVINFLKSLPKRTLKNPEVVGELLESRFDIPNQKKDQILEQLRDYVWTLKEMEEANPQQEASLPKKDQDFQLVWDNYDDAVDHFMEYVYKDILLSIPRIHKDLYYQFARDYRRGELATPRKNMILNQSNYQIEFTDSGVKILYPKSQIGVSKR